MIADQDTHIPALLARMQEPGARHAVTRWLASSDLGGTLGDANPSLDAPGRIVVIAGVNGAGKSSVAGARLRVAGGFYFNPDAEARDAQSRTPGVPKREIASAVWAAGRDALADAIERGLEWVFETTLAGDSIVRLIDHAIDLGRAVHVRYLVLASADLHVARVAARVRAGGHQITEHMIRQRYVASPRNLARVESRLASVAVYDNSTPSRDDAGGTAVPKIIRSHPAGLVRLLGR